MREHFRERIAPNTTTDALACLDRLRADGDPVFLWVHFQDPHGPYTPPEELLAEELAVERARPGADHTLPFGDDHRGLGTIPDYQRLGDENTVARYLAAYHAEIRFLDAEIGRLLDGVRARGLYDDALVVFTADHGEGLGEDDYWFAHGEYLSDALVRVPLFVRRPGAAPGRRAEVAGLTDLMPTLLAQCDVAVPPELPGRDLFAPGAAETPSEILLATLHASSLPRFGMIRDGRKYLVTLDGSGEVAEERLHRLGAEDVDLAPDAPDLAALRADLMALIVRLSTGAEAHEQELSDDEQRALDALGYGGGDG